MCEWYATNSRLKLISSDITSVFLLSFLLFTSFMLGIHCWCATLLWIVCLNLWCLLSSLCVNEQQIQYVSCNVVCQYWSLIIISLFHWCYHFCPKLYHGSVDSLYKTPNVLTSERRLYRIPVSCVFTTPEYSEKLKHRSSQT